MTLSNEYIAGLFDGEGSIVIGRPGPREHELAITISNNYRPVLDEIALQYPGAVNPNRVCWLYRAGHSAAEDFLKGVLPFLRIKQARAELALEFRRTFTSNGRRGPRLTDSVLESREWFRYELSRLNQERGFV